MILLAIPAGVAVVINGLTHAGVLAVICGLAVVAAYYRYDVRRHPRVACRRCGGSGSKRSRVRGRWIRRPEGLCGSCGGKKGVPRPALRLIDSGERKKILAGIAKAKETIRK